MAERWTAVSSFLACVLRKGARRAGKDSRFALSTTVRRSIRRNFAGESWTRSSRGAWGCISFGKVWTSWGFGVRAERMCFVWGSIWGGKDETETDAPRKIFADRDGGVGNHHSF